MRTSGCLILFLRQLLVASGWSRRRHRFTIEVRPIDVQPEGDVQRNDRSDGRVDVTLDLRQLEELVAEHVLATEECGHREADDQNAIEENYAKITILITLFVFAKLMLFGFGF